MHVEDKSMKESDLIYPANQYLKMADKAYLMSYKFDVKEENLRTMNQFLVNYRKKIAPDINHESVLTYREAFEETFHC